MPPSCAPSWPWGPTSTWPSPPRAWRPANSAKRCWPWAARSSRATCSPDRGQPSCWSNGPPSTAAISPPESSPSSARPAAGTSGRCSLARGQAGQARLHLEQARIRGRGAVQGLLHAVEQQLFVVGLLDKVHRAGAEGTHHDGHVGMATDEDDRHVDTTLAQGFLHIQTTHAGHPYIQQHTALTLTVADLEEIPATGKGQGRQPH